MEEKTIELRDYLNVIKRRKGKIILTVFLCFLFSVIFTFLSKPVYRVESVLEIGSVSPMSGGLELTMSPKATAQLCGSEYLLNKVKQELKIRKNKKIKIGVESTLGSPAITISLESPTPKEAVEIINTMTGLIIKDHQAIYEEKIGPLQEQIKKIQEQIGLAQPKEEELLNNSIYYNQLQSQLSEVYRQIASFKKTRIVFPATVPEKPVKPRPVFNLTVSIILGLFLGISLAFLQEYLSKT